MKNKKLDKVSGGAISPESQAKLDRLKSSLDRLSSPSTLQSNVATSISGSGSISSSRNSSSQTTLNGQMVKNNVITTAFEDEFII